jgi:sulfur-carrier protein
MKFMAILRMFAAARQAAGTGRDEMPGDNVGDVLGHARNRYGDGFAAVLGSCRIWVNGESADQHTPVGANDEVAVLPPVSGGAA